VTSGSAQAPAGTTLTFVDALKDGQLTIQADVTFDPGKPITFAVTGGTGAYAGVHGSGVNTPRTVEGTVSDTVITLVP
jgi:hypothetical protein